MRVRFLVALTAILFGSCSVLTAAEDGCGSGRVGDVNGIGGEEPTIGDISFLIDAKFISLSCDSIPCLAEADINQSGGANPTCDDLSIGDIMILIDYLFITGSDNMTLPDCLGETVTDIDGNVYQTVTIGAQVWMAENLKVTHYRNGDSIPIVTDSATWVGLTTGAYCEYNNDVDNAATYGRLYNWYAAVDGRNIAPIGWHVPTDAEWKQLEITLGMSQAQADATGWRGTTEGGKLKEAGTTHWLSPNTGATNESGFTALPGGYRSHNGPYNSMSYNAGYWSSTELYSYPLLRGLDYGGSYIGRDPYPKVGGFSVRCVKDTPPSTITDIDGNVYQTVTIGAQVWMAENLKVTHYRNGDSIPNIEQPGEWLAQTAGAYCNYDNDTSMGNTYGRLYNFAAVADSRELAPVGWHVATDAEWQTLIDTLGGDVTAGDKLKEAGTAHWSNPNSGTNESGFCALPGGSRQYEGAFLDLSVYGVFWSSTEHSADFAWLRGLYYATGYIQTGGAYKPYGYSVRCVRD